MEVSYPPLVLGIRLKAGRIVTSSLLATLCSVKMSLFPTPVGTSDEHRQVSGGTVDSIHREVKQRFFLQIPEVLRIRIEVRYLVGLVRGEQYVRLQSMRGEDFAFVLVRTCLSLYSIRAMAIFDTLTYFLKAKFAIDVSPGDLTFDLPRNAPVSVAYTLLDVLFVCVLSCDYDLFPCQFVDGGLILTLCLKLAPPMERLSYHGECSLAY